MEPHLQFAQHTLTALIQLAWLVAPMVRHSFRTRARVHLAGLVAFRYALGDGGGGGPKSRGGGGPGVALTKSGLSCRGATSAEATLKEERIIVKSSMMAAKRNAGKKH